MQDRPALICWNRLTTRRGAVLLLAVYFTSLFLLILGGIALQRTVIESRAAQVSRDSQQAFFLAEGALDRAIAQTATQTLYDGIVYEVPGLPANYRATYQFLTKAAEVLNPTTQRITRQVVATGSTPSGAMSTVTASISEEGPLSGAWSEGPLWVWGSNEGSTPNNIFHGNIRSGMGIDRSVMTKYSGITIDGSVGVSKPARTDNVYDFYSYLGGGMFGPGFPSNTRDPYLRLVGGAWDLAGVVLYPVTRRTSGSTVPTITGKAYAAPMSPLPADTTYTSTSSQCQSALVQTSSAADVVINDGDARDLHNARGRGVPDGAIELCFQYVFLQNASAVPWSDAQPSLRLNAPATIYVTSSRPADSTDPHAYATAFWAKEALAIQSGDHLYPDGVKIIATQVNPEPMTQIALRPRQFSGSIFAPRINVTVSAKNSPEQELEFSSIVGRDVLLFIGKNQQVTVDHHRVNGSRTDASTGRTSILSWTSQ